MSMFQQSNELKGNNKKYNLTLQITISLIAMITRVGHTPDLSLSSAAAGSGWSALRGFMITPSISP